MNIVKLLRTVLLKKTSGICLFPFDKVTVQHRASADLLFLIKNTMWNLQICSEYFTLLVEPISIRFCWLTCRKQTLVQSKILQQELFVLISDFWEFRHSFLGWDRSNLQKIYVSARKLTWKIDNIKSHLGIRFNETVRPSTKGGEHYYIELLWNKKEKKRTDTSCVFTCSGKVRKCGEH